MVFPRATLGVAVTAVALLLAAGSPAASRAPITQAQSGKTFRLAKGGSATLRLSSRWVWTEPRRSSRAVELTPVAYVIDPGFREWQLTGRARGTVTIRSAGKPGCSGCRLKARHFRVTIRVR